MDAPPTKRPPEPTPDARARPGALPSPPGQSGPVIVTEAIAPAASLRPVPPRLADHVRPVDPPADPVLRDSGDRSVIAAPLAPSRTDTVEILEAQPERHVEVRIGTIEILGPTTAPAAPTPAPVAAVEASPSGGFDAFVRLRTYAPWGR